MKCVAFCLGILIIPTLCGAQHCAKCGRPLASSTGSEVIVSERVVSTTPFAGIPAQPVSYAPSVASTVPTTVTSTVPAVGNDVLNIVNSKRRSRGLSPLMFDPTLTSVAVRKSQLRAMRRVTGHDGSSRGGARVEGVGYAHGGNLASRFSTCYLYSSGYRYGGAAIAYDGSGRAYYTLLLR